jgi:hypothetical protein
VPLVGTATGIAFVSGRRRVLAVGALLDWSHAVHRVLAFALFLTTPLAAQAPPTGGAPGDRWTQFRG